MASINLTFFEQTNQQQIIASFGRKMINFSESGLNMHVPLEILNAFSRVGEELAETGSMKDLLPVDMQVVKYAKKVMK